MATSSSLVPQKFRLGRSMQADVRASAGFLDGVMLPDVAPCMSGRSAVPEARTGALSGDVLRAYDAYQKEVAEAAGVLLLWCCWGAISFGIQTINLVCIALAFWS